MRPGLDVVLRQRTVTTGYETSKAMRDAGLHGCADQIGFESG